jgi:hypothetical protein
VQSSRQEATIAAPEGAGADASAIEQPRIDDAIARPDKTDP